MFQFQTETILNDLSRVSVIDSTTTLAAPAGPAAAGSTTGGTLAAGTYYYKVTALNGAGETTGSTEVSATTTGTTSSVSISWTAVAGATSYKIYKGTAAGAETGFFTDTASPFVDTGAATQPGTVPTTNTASTASDPGVPVGDKALFIKRLNKFLNSNTVAVYKNLGYAPVNEVITFTIPAALVAGTYRLHLDITRSGSYPADYDRYAINKGKPLYVEFNLPANATTPADFIAVAVPLIKKGLIKNNGQAIDIISVTSTATTIIVTAADEYSRFKAGFVSVLSTDGEDYTPVSTGVVTTPGIEGFGTAWSLLKNYRIPTQEATRFMGEDQDERPVNGLIYNQYTIAYEAKRNIGSLDYVGGQGTSHTDHILFVPQTLATTFEASLASAFGAKVVAAF